MRTGIMRANLPGRTAMALLTATAFAAFASAFATAPEARPAHCPPGLADKGCVPPGLAKKWAVGDILPSDYRYIVLDRTAPAGTRYVRVDDEVLLIDALTRTVLDILRGG